LIGGFHPGVDLVADSKVFWRAEQDLFDYFSHKIFYKKKSLSALLKGSKLFFEIFLFDHFWEFSIFPKMKD